MSHPHPFDDALNAYTQPQRSPNPNSNLNMGLRNDNMFPPQQHQFPPRPGMTQQQQQMQFHMQHQQQLQQQQQHQQHQQRQPMSYQHQPQQSQYSQPPIQQHQNRYYGEPLPPMVNPNNPPYVLHQHRQQQQALQQQQQQQQLQEQQQRMWSYEDNIGPPYHRQHHPGFNFNVNANVFVPRNAVNEPGMYDPYNQQRHMQNLGQPAQQHAGPSQYNDYQQQQCSRFQGSPAYQSNIAPKMMYQYDDQNYEAFSQFGQQSQQYMPSKDLYDEMIDSKAANLLNEIQVGCEQLLTESDEDSGTWSSAIRQRFEDKSMDLSSKKTALKLIVEMAYSMEPNAIRSTDPQYTFACLVQTLGKEIPDLIREVILPVLQHFHSSRNCLENDLRVYLAIFFSELFLKVTLANGSRVDLLGDALCTQMEDIMKLPPQDEYMKCMMRVLKISGAELDDTPQLRPRIDDILTKMGGFAKGAPRLSEVIKAQIGSLIECRQRGWDRAPAARSSNFEERYRSDADESIEGLDLTEDEKNFLESQISALEEKDGGEPEIDEELESEFGKFVKEEIERAEVQKTSDLMGQMNIGEKKEDKEEKEDQNQ